MSNIYAKKYCLKLYNNGENGNKADRKELRRNLYTFIWRNTMQLLKRMFNKISYNKGKMLMINK